MAMIDSKEGIVDAAMRAVEKAISDMDRTCSLPAAMGEMVVAAVIAAVREVTRRPTHVVC